MEKLGSQFEELEFMKNSVLTMSIFRYDNFVERQELACSVQLFSK